MLSIVTGTTQVGIVLKSVVALLNVVTIGWAIWFSIFIIDPDKVKRTTQNLIKEDNEVFKPQSEYKVSIELYLDKFAQLEKIIRNIAGKYEIISDWRGRYRNFLHVNEIMRALYLRKLITPQQLDLSLAVRVRNLADHGEIQQIEANQGNIVDNSINQLQKL